MNSSRDPLDPLLATWQVQPPRNPQFRAAVRERIAVAGPRVGWPQYVRAHAAGVAGAVALAVVIGAAGGWAKARAQVDADSRQIASSYVYSLDARNMRMP
jgi:hypothetical protein